MESAAGRPAPAESGWRSWSPGRRVLVALVVLTAAPAVVDAVTDDASLLSVGAGSLQPQLDVSSTGLDSNVCSK